MYNPIKAGDSISSTWGNAVEKALGYGTPGQAYYVMWKSETTYYARNGLTGERTENDNFKTLINDKILELYGSTGTGTGGSIFLHPALYSTDGTINMRPGVHIFGSGKIGSDSFTTLVNTMIFATTDATIFSFKFPDATKCYNSGLHNMEIDGYGHVTSYPLIDISCDYQNVADIYLDTLGIAYGKYGIRVNNAHASNAIFNLFIRECSIESNSYNGILIDSSTDQSIFQSHILGCHFYNNNASGGNGTIEVDGHETRQGIISHSTFTSEKRNGIYLADEADSWVIANNVLIDCSQLTDDTYSGIKLVDVDHISITGNVSIIRTSATRQKYGYEADNNCDYLCVLGNVFSGDTAGASYGTGAANIGSAVTNVDETV